MNPIDPNHPGAKPLTSGLAIASLVLGILSVSCLSILTGVPAVICGHLAQSRIKQSLGALAGGGMALAGLIMGYLSIALCIVVVPMLLAIAIPNFVKARAEAQKNACVANLKAIEGAKSTWQIENKKNPADTPADSDLFGSDKYLRAKPSCPAGGTYSLNPVGVPSTCSIPGHSLRSSVTSTN